MKRWELVISMCHAVTKPLQVTEFCEREELTNVSTGIDDTTRETLGTCEISK